jgi:hypothetical protein
MRVLARKRSSTPREQEVGEREEEEEEFNPRFYERETEVMHEWKKHESGEFSVLTACATCHWKIKEKRDDASVAEKKEDEKRDDASVAEKKEDETGEAPVPGFLRDWICHWKIKRR